MVFVSTHLQIRAGHIPKVNCPLVQEMASGHCTELVLDSGIGRAHILLSILTISTYPTTPPPCPHIVPSTVLNTRSNITITIIDGVPHKSPHPWLGS